MRERTTQDLINLARTSPYGKTTEQLKGMAIAHWANYLPKYVKGLVKRNRLQEVATKAAERAQGEIRELMEAGYQLHEAEEVVLPRYILLKEEPEITSEMEDPNL